MKLEQSARRAWILLGAVALSSSLACANDKHTARPKAPTETTSVETHGPAQPAARQTPPSAGEVQPPGVEESTPGSLSTPPGSRPAYESAPTVQTNGHTASATTGFTDDQILQVLHVANVNERDAAQLAQSRAKDPRVKLFAGMMVREHGDADTKGFDLARRLKLTLSDSALSDQMNSDARVTGEQLRSQIGNADFDRTYIATQVKEHQAVLDAIDNKLMPNAKSAEVKSFLDTTRAKVESHLREAESIQRSLDSRQ